MYTCREVERGGMLGCQLEVHTCIYTCTCMHVYMYMYIRVLLTCYMTWPEQIYLFHVTMEISVHSVENIPRYTADTVGRCDDLVYYLVMRTHMKPDSTVDAL